MEIGEIATQTFDTIQPFLLLGGKEIIKGVASDLWLKVKTVFESKGEEKLLQKFEQSPKDLKTKGKVEYVLENELQNNSDLLKDLTDLINSVKKSENYNTVINQIGDNNISVGGKISNSKIKIQK